MSKACGRWNISRISREEGRRDQKQLSDRVQQTCFPSKRPLEHRRRKWRPPLSILIILSLMEEGAFRFSPCRNNQSNYGIPHCIGVWSVDQQWCHSVEKLCMLHSPLTEAGFQGLGGALSGSSLSLRKNGQTFTSPLQLESQNQLSRLLSKL